MKIVKLYLAKDEENWCRIIVSINLMYIWFSGFSEIRVRCEFGGFFQVACSTPSYNPKLHKKKHKNQFLKYLLSCARLF